MPAPLVWLVLLLGLAAVAGCLILPREIGQQDQPIVNIRLELPRMEEFAARLRKPRRAPRPLASESPSDPTSTTPPAMGAIQPILTQDQP